MTPEKLQKKFYSYIKKKANQIEWKTSQELKSYQKNFNQINSSSFNLITELDLQNKIQDSHIIYVGDFHTFDQNSKNLERLLISLKESKKKVIFGFEFIHQNKQKFVDHFINKYLTEIEFLENINYASSWKFPWSHYKLFFEWAIHKNGPLPILKMVALNSTGNLQKRDAFAARQIVKQISNLKDKSDVIFVVFFGEMHLAKNKLPKIVRDLAQKKLSINLNDIIIHQNLDKVFWKLNQKKINLKDSQIVQLSNKEFSIQSSPPWAKYESFVYWQENIDDDQDFDLHEYLREKGQEKFSGDRSEFLSHTINTLIQVFKLPKLKKDDISFNIYGQNKIELCLDLLNLLPSHPKKVYQELLYKGLIFRFPGTSNLFCNSYSLNRMAYLAGPIITNYYSEQQTLILEAFFSSSNKFKESLFLLILKEHLIAECCSLIYNPYKKCDLYLDFKKNAYAQENKLIPQDRKNAYLYCLTFIENQDIDCSVSEKILCRSAILMAKFLAYHLYNYNRNKMVSLIHYILKAENFPSSPFISTIMKTALKNIDYKKLSKKRY